MFRKNNMIHCTLKGYYVVGQHIATSLRYNAVKTCNDYGWLLKKYQKQYETHLLRGQKKENFIRFKLKNNQSHQHTQYSLRKQTETLKKTDLVKRDIEHDCEGL